MKGDTKDNLHALNQNIWWPDRADVKEFVRNTASQEIVNLINRGKKVYNSCKTCHQVDGLGLPPTYPPLAGSEFVTGDPIVMIKIMLKGMTGPFDIDGVHYDDHMPAAPVKNDYDIAAVITYVRQAWGNNADAVKQSEVSTLRTQFKERRAPWHVNELETN